MKIDRVMAKKVNGDDRPTDRQKDRQTDICITRAPMELKNQTKLFKCYDNEVKTTKPSISKSRNICKMRPFF